MAEVIPFPENPLRPYLGVWRIDPLSVGRRKKSLSKLADPGFARLWKCPSMAARNAMLAADAELAARYSALSGRIGRTLEVSAGRLVFAGLDGAGQPREENCPIVKVTAEGRSVIAQVLSRRQLIGYVFRRQQSFVLVSERYYGRAATLYPRSPVFRYYQDAQPPGDFQRAAPGAQS